VLILKPLGWTF